MKKRPLFTSSVPQSNSKPKIKWKILPILWGALKKTCMVIGAMVLISMIFTFYMAMSFSPQAPAPLPDEMVLFIEFNEPLAEVQKNAGFANPKPTVRDIINTLDRAAEDKRVKGLFARFEGAGFAPAHVQELRASIKRFKGSGKFTYAYSPSFMDLGGGFGGYYFASAFDEIWMQPLGAVSVAGLSFEIPYLKGLLDWAGVQGQFFQRKDYKTVFESITRSEMSLENRTMNQRLLNDLRGEMVKEIAADRGMTPLQFEALVNQGLFTAEEAVSAGLITKADYADVLVGDMKMELQGDRDSEDQLFVPLAQYRAQGQGLASMHLDAQALMHQKDKPKKPKVALVYASGPIMYSKADINTNVAAADEIAPALLEAAYDDAVKAIVLRVDSPGGSALASESILRAVQRAKEKGKTVIVSMGPTAASGGYWISAYADEIFALPTTITGSIGVAGGKFVLQDLWTKIGVNWESVQWGENADLLSFNKPFDAAGEKRFNAMLDSTYDAFITRVAKGRSMSPEAVDAIAGGRVWTGKRAVELGLVDQLGGLYDALDYTAGLLEVESQKDLQITVLPKPKSFVDQLLEIFEGQGLVLETLRLNGAALQTLEPALRDLQVMSGPSALQAYEPLRLE